MNLCVVTTIRADFGLLKNLIKNLKKTNLNTKVISAGTHSSAKFGNTFVEIQEAKIKVFKKII